MRLVGKYIFFVVAVVAALLLCSCDGDRLSGNDASLYDELLQQRYGSLPRYRAVAMQWDSIGGREVTSFAAQNALAYVAFMNMDYEGARLLYSQVADNSRNEIERLVADVGLMTVSYRVSSNRDFFDYRSRALRRVARINEEEAGLSPAEMQGFLAAKIELSAVSLCYFSNLGMIDEAQRASQYLKKNLDAVKSTPMRLYARMMLNYASDVPAISRVESLCAVMERAEREGLQWIAANCRLMLAVLLRDGAVRETVVESLPTRISAVNKYNAPLDELSYRLAIEAVDSLGSYGDEYMMIEGLAVAASSLVYNSDFESAVSLLDEAMGHINGYYSRYYPSMGLQPFELSFVDDETERARIENDTVDNIFELLLSVRREAGCAFAGLGDKYVADMNRNSYLDLLRSTRLNKQIDSRIQNAADSASRLYLWLVLVVVVLVAVVVLLVVLSAFWSRRNAEYTKELGVILKVCRRLMVMLPQEISDKEDVYKAVSDILNGSLSGFSGDTLFSIVDGEENSTTGNYLCRMPLPSVDDNKKVLCVSASQPIDAAKYRLLQILLPYVAVAVDEGMHIADIGDERQRLEHLYSSYSLYLADHKRENIVKRVSLSVVNGMAPYMNRMLNEANRLLDAKEIGATEERRLDYLMELTESLDRHNAIIERWIKMRSGEFNLKIESFPVSQLFDILSKSTQAFALKGIRLSVKESDAVVKADRALTLFMLNTLAENAGKFTPRGGEVSIEAQEGDGFVELAVSDTGCGLTPEEKSLILNNKLYDASSIGRNSDAKSKKGSGFGLMNCKGIIEKYRKTDEMFAVCRMDIESCAGKGSRFSFRLPKGVMRAVSLLMFAITPLTLMATDDGLDAISSLADSVYTNNVRGDYAAALEYSKMAIEEFNGYYRATVGGDDTLNFSGGEMAELGWWRASLYADSLIEDVYFNLLDIRNETAVAALALNRWDVYRYNNSIYTQLYRLVHEDSNLVKHYEQMRSVANYRKAAVAICVALLIVLLITSIVMYMRRVLLTRMNTRMLLQVNARLLQVTRGGRDTVPHLAANIAREIFEGTHEYLRVKSVVVFLEYDDNRQLSSVPYDADERTAIFLQEWTKKGEAYLSADGLLRVLPLVSLSSGERCSIGAVQIETGRRLSTHEAATVELLINYAASAAYHSIVRLAQTYRAFDDIEEETMRMKYEENHLHVCNMVMDNCLSMIKHETIYYPSRIRLLIEKLRKNCSDDIHGQTVAIKELLDYYSSVSATLADCASRQLDDMSFKPVKVELPSLVQHIKGYVKRRAVRCGKSVVLESTERSFALHADRVLLEFLLESLCDGMLAYGGDGVLRLDAKAEDGFVCVEMTDTRHHMSVKDLSAMFVPGESDAVELEFLVAKEIIRMHEEYMNCRGCRMEIRDGEDGTVLLFTLPLYR